ncbi:MAG: hypothetical protein KDE22_04250, partial [Rhodobacterales bacterium]|nr:hypothetical protein [Rhodobacterales bacterium]
MGFFRGGKRVPGRFVLLCAASVATGTLLAGGPSAAQSRADAASDSVIVNMDALGDLAPYGTVSAGAASTVGLTGGDRRLLMPGPTPPGSEFHLGPPLTPPSAPRL